jgi:hypothetical protein
MIKADLIKEYTKLTNNSIVGKQRGFAFETLFNKLLEEEKLFPSFSYKPTGEQIDGMFEYQNRFFHVECKWEDAPIPASSIYSLRGKLDGKLSGCLGVFISMSDYSIDCPAALEKGKDVNILLFTKVDMDSCFSHNYTFSEILKIKLRYAALYGSCLYEHSTHLQLTKQGKAK